ncbi:MAG: hypothetical protein KAR20_02300, partial [Candidatus Heimdallarchaeota archaeon]|nr:hypothetical protein [Candidatus Heimdallarchaeota archaeon]
QNCTFPDKLNHVQDIDDVLALLSHFEKNGGCSVFFTGGGEPGAFPFGTGWFRLFEYFAQSNMILTLNTNGMFVRQLKNMQRMNNGAEVLRNVFSFCKEPSIVSFSIHVDNVYKNIKELMRLRDALRLNIVIRATYLVHRETTIEEVDECMRKASEAGVEVLSFKPVHYITKLDAEIYGIERQRMFGTNEEVYDHIMHIQVECDKKNAGEESLYVYNTMIINTIRLDRLTRTFAEKSQEHLKKENADMDVCLAPFCLMHTNTLREWAVCCDVKDFGLGKSKKEVFGNNIPQNPQEYYLRALFGVVKLQYKPNCIVGCSFMESNKENLERYHLFQLNKLIKSLRREYHIGKISDEDVIYRLKSYFECPAKNVDDLLSALRDEASIESLTLKKIYGEAQFFLQQERYISLFEEFKSQYPTVS